MGPAIFFLDTDRNTIHTLLMTTSKALRTETFELGGDTFTATVYEDRHPLTGLSYRVEVWASFRQYRPLHTGWQWLKERNSEGLETGRTIGATRGCSDSTYWGSEDDTNAMLAEVERVLSGNGWTFKGGKAEYA